MNSSQEILIVDHDVARRNTLYSLLNRRPETAVLVTDDPAAAFAMTERRPISALFCALDLPRHAALALIRELSTQRTAPPLVLFGAQATLLATAERIAQTRGLRVLGHILLPTNPLLIDDVLARLKNHPQDAPLLGTTPPQEGIDDIVRGIAMNEFEPFFQPIIDLENNRVIQVEALARWRHHEKGLIHPARFIPVLERCDMMDAITGIMVNRSAQACRRWQDAGHALQVSVNLSSVSLADPELADDLANRVLRHEVPPERFVFEFNETNINANPAEALENVLKLRMYGFGLAIDDFGVGGASLKQLSALPFTQIKIDRAFVHGASSDPTLSTILETSLTLARRLGMEAVAEGVERDADLKLLRELGCDRIQGYASAEAMPEEELLPWIAAQQYTHKGS